MFVSFFSFGQLVYFYREWLLSFVLSDSLSFLRWLSCSSEDEALVFFVLLPGRLIFPTTLVLKALSPGPRIILVFALLLPLLYSGRSSMISSAITQHFLLLQTFFTLSILLFFGFLCRTCPLVNRIKVNFTHNLISDSNSGLVVSLSSSTTGVFLDSFAFSWSFFCLVSFFTFFGALALEESGSWLLEGVVFSSLDLTVEWLVLIPFFLIYPVYQVQFYQLPLFQTL